MLTEWTITLVLVPDGYGKCNQLKELSKWQLLRRFCRSKSYDTFEIFSRCTPHHIILTFFCFIFVVFGGFWSGFRRFGRLFSRFSWWRRGFSFLFLRFISLFRSANYADNSTKKIQVKQKSTMTISFAHAWRENTVISQLLSLTIYF